MTHRDTPRAPWRRPGLVFGLLLSGALVVAGCSNDNGQNSLEPKGKNALKINHLFTGVFWVAAIIGVGVLAAVVIFAIRFRYREGVNDNPKQIHGSTPLEIGWTIVPALILAVVAVPTIKTIFDLAKEPGPSAIDVTVSGQQWWWQVQYPKQHVVTSGEIHMVAGRPLRVALKSNNVIHSFWVPELAGKTDAFPGRTNRTTLYANKPGTYLGQCAQYCGLSHANMHMRVIAQTQRDFDAWLAGQQRGPVQPFTGTPVAQLVQQKYQCVNCHVFDDSTKAPYGPNLTHLASRTTFAGATFELNKSNLLRWIKNAPSMNPMQSKDCRLPPPATCVGMPSFTKNTPKGYPVMTDADANTIATYLLGAR